MENILYVFNDIGQHVRTKDSRTDVILLNLDYDSGGRLLSQRDQFGKVTLFYYYTEKVEIVSPYGQTTVLNYDDYGHLSAITNPANETYQIENDPQGLLVKFRKPMGQESIVSYDSRGRVLLDTGAGGDLVRLVSSFDANTGNQFVEKSTARDIKTFYETSSDGTTSVHNIYGSRGQTTTFTYEREGIDSFENNYGERSQSIQEPDPRLGWMAPYTKEYKFKIDSSPIDQALSTTTVVEGTDPNIPFSFNRIVTERVEQNDPSRKYTDVFDHASRTGSTLTPEGRITTHTLNDKNLISKIEVEGLFPINFLYNDEGNLKEVKQGERITRNKYNELGNLSSVKLPTGERIRYRYDQANRLIKQILPNGKVIKFEYDMNGNMTAIKPPGRKAHRFHYNDMDLVANYLPPELRAEQSTETEYFYNLDRQLQQVRLADGNQINFDYDPVSGMLGSIATPRGLYIYDYTPFTDLVNYTSSPDYIDLLYSHIGSSIKSVETTGLISSKVTYNYNPDATIKSIEVSDHQSTNVVNLDYDRDKFSKQVGELEIERGSFGEVKSTNIQGLRTDHLYSRYGEVQSSQYHFDDEKIYSRKFQRDKLGRIISSLEEGKDLNQHACYLKKGKIWKKIESRKKFWGWFKKRFYKHKKRRTDFVKSYTRYSYDKEGRLEKVFKDKKLVRQYKYDANGNRRWKKSGWKLTKYKYDKQDRLLRAGHILFKYNARGDLEKKIEKKKTTFYDYDVFGNLKSVSLPNGKEIQYLADGRNRRVAKLVDGQIKQGFIYQSQLQVAAELDSNSKIIKQFIYGEKDNIPDYMVFEGKYYRIISDQVGTPQMIVETQSGDVVAKYDYDEFGVLLKKEGTIDIPFGFAGGLYDPDTGLTRFGARDYDASVGRWTSKDPIGFNGGDTNLYGYVLNDPINFIDPSGQIGLGTIGAVGAALGALYYYEDDIFDFLCSYNANCDRENRKRKAQNQVRPIPDSQCYPQDGPRPAEPDPENLIPGIKNFRDTPPRVRVSTEGFS